LIFPSKPTCHAKAQRFSKEEFCWRAPRVDAKYAINEPFRRCSYCGSIHPEDLIKLLGEGAELQGADWKYNWPHKFYVNGIPNKTTELLAKVGGSFKDGVETSIIGPPPRECWTKWYNEHIMDDGFDQEARSALLSVLEMSGIKFSMVGDKLHYTAPKPGYQK
jgi:hypothetical protein